MNGRNFAGVTAVALAIAFAGTLAFTQTQTRADAAKSPGCVLGASAPDPGGRWAVYPGGRVAADAGGRGGPLAACNDDIAKYCTGQNGFGARTCLMKNSDKLSDQCKTALASIPAPIVPACSHSPVCDSRYGGTRRDLQ